jgi:predicted outer membrane repeat protein
VRQCGSGGNGGNAGSGSQPGIGGGGNANGGAVYLSGSDLHETINTTFGQNSATAGSAGQGGSKGLGDANSNGVTLLGRPTGPNGLNGANGNAGFAIGGGAYVTNVVFTSSSTTVFVNDTFTWNSATTQGGGIYVPTITFIFPPPPAPPPPTPPLPPLLVNTILQNDQALEGPDIYGNINQSDIYDFVGVGDVNQWFTGAGAKPLAGTIVNVNTPQLESTRSSAPLPGGGTSPYFYRLLPGSLAVTAGTATVLHDIAVAEIAAGVIPPGSPDDAAVDETLKETRTADNGNLIDMGAVQFLTAYSTVHLSFIPGSSFTLPIGTTTVNVQTLVTQGTNPGSLPINGGTVAFNLEQGSSLLGSSTANVSSIGIASAAISLPANLPAGQYTITASYANSNGGPANPHGTFTSAATATLTIGQAPTADPPAPSLLSPSLSSSSPSLSLPPQVGPWDLVIDVAALLLQGDSAALSELELVSNAILHYPLPTSLTATIEAIQSLYPQTGSLGLAYIAAGMSLAQELE